MAARYGASIEGDWWELRPDCALHAPFTRYLLAGEGTLGMPGRRFREYYGSDVVTNKGSLVWRIY
jgi:hypothetical protein